MPSARIGQAAVIIFIMIVAASCAATKNYTSKLFTPRTEVAKDNKVVALKFLDIDSTEKNDANWVSTDYIMGRDTLNKTFALDKLSEVYPSGNGVKKPDSLKTVDSKAAPVLVTKPVIAESEPVAKYFNPGEVRTKRTRE